MSFLIPRRLETERLTLREFQHDDWPDLHRYYSDETCMKYTNGSAMTDWQSWRAMACMTGHWALRGFGPYAVEEKASSRIIGPVGLWYPLEWPEPEIKWGLARKYWGKGYASEAARAVKAMAAESVPQHRLISLIHPENESSIRVAKAVGAKREGKHVLRGITCHVYRHTRERK